VMPSALFLSLALLLSTPASQSVRHFKQAPTSQFPRQVLERDLCGEEVQDCWENFLTEGSLWAGDVNGDGADELMVFPGGGWVGAGGEWYFLYEKRGKDWVSLTNGPNDDDDEDGWFTLHPRFDILPVVRNGYHDLRVAADLCVKWDGKEYVDYDPADYHSLNPVWFNNRDSHDAETFWAIHYAGHDKVIFTPQWFPISLGDFDRGRLRPGTVLPEHYLGLELNDRKEHIRWYAPRKGGVWGIRGNQVFFLAPQVSETAESVGDLKIDGDWLLGSGIGASRPSIRYNRRTHELILDPHDYDDAESPDK